MRCSYFKKKCLWVFTVTCLTTLMLKTQRLNRENVYHFAHVVNSVDYSLDTWLGEIDTEPIDKGFGWQEKLPTENTWQSATSDDQLFVFSAYYDGTISQDNNDVDILGIKYNVGKELDNNTIDIQCLFWYDNTKKYTSVLPSEYYIFPEHHDRRYKPAGITCPLNDNIIPSVVSIVNKMSTKESPTNYVNVTINIPADQGNLHNFTMCLSPIFGNSHTVEDYGQYFELNRLLGADYFVVYNYSLTNSKSIDVIKYYQRKGLVDLVQWELPDIVQKGTWYYSQMAMMWDCMLRSRGISRYVVTTDLDEFIIPLNNMSWKELLSKQPDACEYNVQSSAFRKKHDVRYNKSSIESRLVALNRFDRSKNIFMFKERSKYFINPDCVKMPGVHYSYLLKPPVDTRDVVNVSEKDALVYHYNNRVSRLSKLETVKDTRMLKYESALVQNVKTVLNNII